MKSKKSKLAALFLTIIVSIAAAGCGDSSQPEEVNSSEALILDESTLTEETEKETEEVMEEETKSNLNIEKRTMGRYVESMQNMEEAISVGNSLTKMQDGSIQVAGTTFGKAVAEDNVQVFKHVDIPWVTELGQKAYLADMEISSDGYTAIKYNINTSESEETDTEETKEMVFDWKYMLVSPEGTQVSFGEDIGEIEYSCFSEKGELFVLADENKIYQINRETGKADLVMEIEETRCSLTVYGNQLTTADHKGIYFYDLSKKEKIQDDVINEFYKQFIGQYNFYEGNYYNALIYQNEENVIYIACEAGLFRHAIGGNAIEQVIDGNLNSFSNPSISFVGMCALENNSFLVLFTGGAIASYTFDPDMPAVPEIQIKAYSLYKSDIMQQAVTLFQQKHPEAFVKYEVGIDNGSSVTKEDALKRLNTKILAGTGPDILVLDEMPINSYIEKGILADITPFLDELEQSEKLIGHIKNTYKADNKIYAVPVKFRLPIIMGDKDMIEGINSLKDMADAVEKIRSEYQEGPILNLYQEEQVLMALGIASAPGWQNEDGSLNEEAITEYLKQAKRIYEAEMAGITQEKIDENKKMLEDMQDIINTSGNKEDYYVGLGINSYNVAAGYGRMAVGYLTSDWDIASVTSAVEAAKNPNMTLKSFTLGNGNLYLPYNSIGILTSSSNQKMAGELLGIMLGKENQDLSYGGFSVNQESFDGSFISDYASPGDVIGGMGNNTLEGAAMLEIKWPQDSWMDWCKGELLAADTPNLTDTVLKETIYELGIKALNGEKTIEETVNDIMTKLSIYMAE